jgi:hypothetical protein
MSTRIHRLGYHYFPDARHYTERDLKSWLPILHEHGASWVTLRGRTTHAIPEAFIQGLLEAEIRPILHLPADVGDVRARDLYPLLVSYARWGVRHVVVHDRPNSRLRWKNNAWSHRRLVERFLDNLIPILKLQQEIGLKPVFPPLEPGGDYWDTAFLQSALVSLARRGEDSLLDELVLAAYGWSYGQPLSWGAGGPEKWPESRPYHTPEESQDQLGFRIYEWYGSVASKILGAPLPMLIIAGGPTNGEDDFDGSPKAAIEQVRAMMRIILRGELPEAVEAFCFYPFVAGRQDPLSAQAWYSEDGTAGTIAEAACEILDLAPHAKTSKSKSIQHYLLLPDDADQEHLEIANVFLSEHKATAGFSIEEACSAQRVTILPSNTSPKKNIEAELTQSGCELEWLDAVESFHTLSASDSKALDADDLTTKQGADHG